MNNSGFYKQSNTADSSPPLSLRPREAAATLGISCSTLGRLTRAGKIQSVLVGRCRLYELSVLESFLKSRRTAGEEVAV